MPIELSEANAISSWTVFGMGIGMVFVGLIAIIVICSVMGFLCKKLIKEKPVAANTQAAASPQSSEIPNKGEFVAAVSAAIAESLGTDVSSLRILSVKKL